MILNDVKPDKTLSEVKMKERSQVKVLPKGWGRPEVWHVGPCCTLVCEANELAVHTFNIGEIIS